jgi:hypothetical protein
MEPTTTDDGHYTAAYWHKRAEEARVRADEMMHADARAKRGSRL